MRHSVKAALLSALIFPGLGHILVGYKMRGGLIISACVVSFYFLINGITEQAYKIVAELEKSGAALDIVSITEARSQLSLFSDNTYLNLILIFLAIIWVISVVDAYRLGNKRDRSF